MSDERTWEPTTPDAARLPEKPELSVPIGAVEMQEFLFATTSAKNALRVAAEARSGIEAVNRIRDDIRAAFRLNRFGVLNWVMMNGGALTPALIDDRTHAEVGEQLPDMEALVCPLCHASVMPNPQDHERPDDADVVCPVCREGSKMRDWRKSAPMAEVAVKGLSFGDAIRALKAGKRVCREGWNGRGMYLWLLPAAMVKAEWCREPHLKAVAEANGGEIEALGSIRMMTADKKVLTGWLASQTDVLSDDWQILD